MTDRQEYLFHVNERYRSRVMLADLNHAERLQTEREIGSGVRHEEVVVSGAGQSGAR